MTTEHKQLGIARISFEKMLELLDLPEGHQIVDVTVGQLNRKCRVFDVLIQGPMMPRTAEGFEPYMVNFFRGRELLEGFGHDER